MSALEIRRFDHPDVVPLVERLQAEYVRIYGGPDDTPTDASEFAPPAGGFGVGYADGAAVAMGGWRHLGGGRAELKRMYVADEHRGRGHSRAVLRWLEADAAAGGVAELVLETNERHPAALALYRSAGYARVASFGLHVDDPRSVHLGRALPAVGDRS
ncbi:GNAT family N-acetyltransferase [Saccharopolyspora cebuensis]|uniref:GNAT family N-acetyltransferase n=1 Tax=Saccharopolyspora cebuensis TaxID=418759 RepID=A0ABV4CP82_9PSEU